MGVRLKTALGRIQVVPDSAVDPAADPVSPSGGVPSLPAFRAELASYNDQLIRQTRVYHVQLSMMADGKANMLLTISSVLVTLTAAHLGEAHYRWPGMVLMAGCLLAVVFAALTTLPKFFRGGAPASRIAPAAPLFNPLFFGDFARLSYDEYLQTMERVMATSSTAYEVQLREIYLLGSFLAHSKYRWLRFGYLSFLCGLAGSVVVWLVQTL